MLPTARRTGVLVRALGDELIVFDRATLRAHRLNPTAAAVWRACDGATSVAGLCTRAIAAGASRRDSLREAEQIERHSDRHRQGLAERRDQRRDGGGHSTRHRVR